MSRKAFSPTFLLAPLAVSLALGTGFVMSVHSPSAQAWDDSRYCQSEPNAQPMPLSAFFTQLEKDGYQVREFEHKRNCYKIEGKDSQGKRIEAYFDFGSGKLIHSESDF